MSRSISNKVKVQLACSSNNLCGNPLCLNPIMDPITRTVIGQIAHIVPYSSNGPRGNEVIMNEEEINSYDNLLFLCPECHKIIDTNPNEYPTHILKEWKKPWLFLNIQNFIEDFLKIVSKYDLYSKTSVKIIRLNSYWILGINNQSVGNNFFSDIDYFNIEMDNLYDNYCSIIPTSLKVRVAYILNTFNNLVQCFAFKTYPQNINGIDTPVFNHENIDFFNELNSDLEKCNNALCQILNKFSSIR
ncbi:HNH endonuclease [Treponema pedis]|uniref:HNH endonuclease n=1 Tax=Treponema pedis TaxID=409322 RepID=UPI0004163113|nr:HNH endonuclease [Treponema pedis]